jgi:hypothetical protein
MSTPQIPEHLESSFKGPRSALAWLRAQYEASPSDALRAHALRSADGCAALDSIRAANPFPRAARPLPIVSKKTSFKTLSFLP